MGFGKLKGML